MAMSSSMYCMYKEIHPATAIEHSIQCNFFNLWETNLVIAGANQLHVYRLNSEPDVSLLEIHSYTYGDGHERHVGLLGRDVKLNFI